MTLRSHLLPPTANRFRREARRVVVDADAHPTLVLRDVIDAVGNGLAQLLVHEIVDQHFFGLSLRLPFPPAILEFPDHFLLFGVHRDHRLAAFLKRQDGCVDVLELGVAVGVIASLPSSCGCSANCTPPLFNKRPTVRGLTGCPCRVSSLGQLRRALARPTQRRLRIASRRRIDQPFQRGRQFGIDLVSTFATAARFSQPLRQRRLRDRLLAPPVPPALWRSCSATCLWRGSRHAYHPNHTTSLPPPPTDDASVRPSAKPRQHTEIQSLEWRLHPAWPPCTKTPKI